ncbi:MAG: hypothetical protein AB7U52_02630 [Candidatus Izemoplasmatales bacterium]
MKKYFTLWKDLRNDFSIQEILSAFYGALVFNLFLAVPALVAIAQIISVYIYYLTTWIVLIIIVMILLNYVFHLFWKKALYLKRPDAKADIKALFLYNQIIVDVLYLIIGLLFIFVFVPMLMV